MLTKTITEQDYIPHISHNVPIKYNFNKIIMNGDESITAITICIELPKLHENYLWCENYKHNMLKTFKIHANDNFCYNMNDFLRTEQYVDREDDNVYISILPHDKFKFHLFMFENAFTNLVIRPISILYKQINPGLMLTFRPKVTLIIDYKKD